jgi:hypothetical protein
MFVASYEAKTLCSAHGMPGGCPGDARGILKPHKKSMLSLSLYCHVFLVGM